MNHRIIRKLLLASLPLAALLLAFGMSSGSEQPAQDDNVLALQAPGFVEAAQAETAETTDFPTDEVGMSAWFEASSSIDLNSVRDAFRTIEAETDDYIIGSVPVGDYPESEDVHVYVHTDGWVLAYYLAAEPVGKIFDWRVYHDSGQTSLTTKLENTLAAIAVEAGVSFPGGTHYDFRYPNASHLMLIVDWTNNNSTDTFEINLPGTLAYYERSWSLGSTGNTCGGDGAVFSLNGESIRNMECNSDFCTDQGILTAGQLLPDQFHTISVYANHCDHGYGGLALAYGEQQ